MQNAETALLRSAGQVDPNLKWQRAASKASACHTVGSLSGRLISQQPAQLWLCSVQPLSGAPLEFLLHRHWPCWCCTGSASAGCSWPTAGLHWRGFCWARTGRGDGNFLVALVCGRSVILQCNGPRLQLTHIEEPTLCCCCGGGLAPPHPPEYDCGAACPARYL